MAMSPRYTTEDDLLTKLRTIVRVFGQQEFADVYGLDKTWLSRVVRGEKGMTDRIAHILGYEKRTLYVKIKVEKGEGIKRRSAAPRDEESQEVR